MSDRNWGLIGNGEQFEALVTTLIFFEDHQAKPFGRRGKDGGQDARSGDGATVFQAKYHEGGSAAKAIADAKSEAEKIALYRSPDHERAQQWAGVTHWTLVTNATFNPTDDQKWTDDVAPLFRHLGLTVKYWERANLDALLDKHPEVDRSFFGGETRVFLTLPEAEVAALDAMPIHQPAHLPRCVGREGELNEARGFLAGPERVLMISGPGGVGKTRLLLEAGAEAAADGEWQVLWALKDSMEASAAWFDAVPPERKTLLLVDEPDDESLLKLLFEQVGARFGRAPQWKIALTVRSPKDPVVKFLQGSRQNRHVSPLAIKPLNIQAAEEMCRESLSSSSLATQGAAWIEDAAATLAGRFDRYPMWLDLAVHVLERHGDLGSFPNTIEDLAREYLDEAATRQNLIPIEQFRDLLRWVALLGPVNQQDQASMEVLREGVGIADAARLREILRAQVARRLFIQRGAYDRLLELKPDVLRDQVLLDWLVENLGYGLPPLVPSEAGRALVGKVLDELKRGQLGPLHRSMLTSLGRTELIFELSDRAVPLLAAFYEGVEQAMPELSASTRVLLAQVVTGIAFFNPASVVELSQLMRTSPVETETAKGLFRDRQVAQHDVVLELPWAIFHAAMGARTDDQRRSVLEELLALVRAEDEIRRHDPTKLRNDGKRADALVKRILEGGPQFWGDFDDVVLPVAECILDHATHSGADAADLAAVRALLIPAVIVQRTHDWTEGLTFRIEQYMVLPESTNWKTRARIMERARAILEEPNSDQALRALAWGVLTEAHDSAYQCVDDKEGPHDQLIRSELLSDLQWAKELISREKPALDELSVARELWHWHYRYDGDAEIRRESERLESLYNANDLAAEFEPLLGTDSWEEQPELAREKAEQLANQPQGAVRQFLMRAERVPGIDKHRGQMLTVALALGEYAPESDTVRSFLGQTLADPSAPPALADFAAVAAASWMATVRRADPAEANRLVGTMFEGSADENRFILVQRLYGGSPPRIDAGTMSPAEHERLRGLADWFHEHGWEPQFIEAVSWTVDYDWEGLRRVVESTLNRTPLERVDSAVIALVNGIYWFMRGDGNRPLPAGTNTWLLDQWIRLPDVGRREDMLLWELGEMIKATGRVPVQWLVQAIRLRREAELEFGLREAPAVDGRGILTRFVEPLSQSSVADQASRDAVDALLDFEGEQTSVNYYLPSLLRGIDPNGFVVPSAVADRIRQAEGEDHTHILRLARFAGTYPLASEPWREIARAALKAAQTWTAAQRQRLYGLLSISVIPRVFTGIPGTAPPIFAAEAEAANDLLHRESDDLFRPFWVWRVGTTEREARDWEERAKEDLRE